MTSLRARRDRSTAGYVPPITIERSSGLPIHRQIYAWFQSAIAEGRLSAGQPVLSSRALAVELGVSRAPVLAAFEQLLAEGFLEASPGRCTRVSRKIPNRLPGAARKKAQLKLPAGSRTISELARQFSVEEAPWLAHPGAFRVSVPAMDRFPVAQWSKLLSRHTKRSPGLLLSYGDAMGHPALRNAISQYLGASRGVQCSAEQIMIVSGSQQALQIAARVLLNAGDKVWMEEPGYPGAHAAFTMAGAEMVPVPVDKDGIDVAEGARRHRDARLAYVTPSHQYPLGSGMSASRRMQLLNWAAAADAWILEDDYDSEFRFGARPVMALQGLDTSARVIYLGTFSKVMYPALRVGYIVVPADLVRAFRSVREAMDIAPPTLVHAALADFIVEGHFSRHLRKMRTLYMQRRNALVAALERHLADHFQIVGIEAGMFLTTVLRGAGDDVEIARAAAAAGLSTIPMSTCCLSRPAVHGLMLGYGSADTATIEPSVAALSRIVKLKG